MSTVSEILPLLSHGIVPTRLHYLDNLRATLTVLVIFHHAAVECGQRYLLSAILINVNKYSLWVLFFFVSGYSASLSLAASTDRKFVVSRTIKIGLPALLYAMVGQKIIFWFVNMVWNPGWPYVRFSGPVAYVAVVLMMDCIYLAVRWMNRVFPNLLPSGLKSLVRPDSREQCRSTFGYGFLVLSLFIFYRCLLGHLPSSSPLDPIPSNDIPAFDAPFSYIFAYVVGVNFEVLAEYITFDLPTAYASLVVSLILSYSSMAVASDLSDSLAIFIRTRDQYPFTNAGINPHTIFFALWAAFVLFSIPICILSIFRRASWATREWGFMARHTYAQMYINMVPVLLAVHYTGWVADVTLRILLVGLIGVGVSWMVMLVCTAEAVTVFWRNA